MTASKATSTTQIITALNMAWGAIKRKNPDLGNVMITTGRKRHKSEANTRGSHCRDTWHVHDREEKAAEVWISGERLAEGATAVMQTLLHEAAHELARVRKLQDTSNKNRYHNKTFVKLAEELGLQGPDSSGGTSLGYSNCTITPATETLYVKEVERLSEACKSFVAPTLTDVLAKVKQPTIKAYCECDTDDNSITWTKKLEKRYDETGFFPLMCSVCRQVFVPEGEDRPKDGSNHLNGR